MTTQKFHYNPATQKVQRTPVDERTESQRLRDLARAAAKNGHQWVRKMAKFTEDRDHISTGFAEQISVALFKQERMLNNLANHLEKREFSDK